MTDSKQQVRDFYDQIGWSVEENGRYQNARYEDLRPVARQYVHDCHMRVLRYLPSKGNLLLDAGSGPVQYPEYLEYSAGYRHRVCADISITALREARAKLGAHGLLVVADIANLPFRRGSFDAAVSMHAIHHLPMSEHRRAYVELARTIKAGATAVVVNGWHQPLLMKAAEPLIRIGRALDGRGRKQKREWAAEADQAGTFVEKMTPSWLKKELAGAVRFEIHPWRSLSPRFMRWFIRPGLGGRQLLRLVFRLEETFPKFFGEHGQYPLITVTRMEGEG